MQERRSRARIPATHVHRPIGKPSINDTRMFFARASLKGAMPGIEKMRSILATLIFDNNGAKLQ